MKLAALVTAGFLAQAGLLLSVSAQTPPAAAPKEAPSPQAVEFFEKKVRPVLAEQCYGCHGTKSQFASLRLDSRPALLKGGDKGAVLVPGDPAASRLITALSHTGPVKMPPKGKLPDAAIANLTAWVKMGAPWPASDGALSPASMEERVAEARQKHWSLQPVRKPAVPRVKAAKWARNPIDQFVLAKLEVRGLTPLPAADRRTLVRRAYLDLVGLPPTPKEIADFVTDTAPDAWEKLVDRLLSSPHYGERWGRQWLDVARYSDTLGYLVQPAERRLPYAYTYRDYVIRAFNEDKPYDRFLQEQLAADQLELKDRRDLAALGFITIGNRYLGNRHEIIDDRIDVVTRGLQGLTVGCARCHDHKFDPIPTADYYSLYAVFNAVNEPEDLPVIGEAPTPAQREFQAKYDELKKREAQFRAEKKDGEAGNINRELKALVITHAGAPPRAMVVADVPKPPGQKVFLRGNPGSQGSETPRQFLLAVAGEKRQPFAKGSGRLELAQALASPENPLTARVMVNRVWLGHFGRGLIGTPSDFGLRGELPSHPELLDWLSATFMEQGWSLKKLHRLIATSATYQQASDWKPSSVNPKSRVPQSIDPENRLLWRMNRRRLDFEQIRDGMLRASGVLDPAVGGRSVDILADTASGRRTVYAFTDRQDLPSLFRTFDFADANQHSPMRSVTTVPQQALFLMNNGFVHQQARNLLKHADVKGEATDEGRIRQINRLVYGRSPSADEVRTGLDFVRRLSQRGGETETEGSPWSYGYGEFDADSNRLKSFTPMPHYTGQAWQGGAKLPDPRLGWVTINQGGGHTGGKYAAVWRWTAPRDLSIRVSGQLRHPSSAGDGVEAVIVSSRGGKVAQAAAHNGSAEVAVANLELKRGETLDLLVHCRTNENTDSFQWSPRIEAVTGGSWDASGDFTGPRAANAPKPLTAWEAYAQALLMTNEFLFVD